MSTRLASSRRSAICSRLHHLLDAARRFSAFRPAGRPRLTPAPVEPEKWPRPRPVGWVQLGSELGNRRPIPVASAPWGRPAFSGRVVEELFKSLASAARAQGLTFFVRTLRKGNLACNRQKRTVFDRATHHVVGDVLAWALVSCVRVFVCPAWVVRCPCLVAFTPMLLRTFTAC